MRITSYILIFFSIFISTGCVSNGYKDFYTSYTNEKERLEIKNNPNLIFLKTGEEPKLIYSNNFEKDIKELNRKHYMQIGYSSFNGELEDINNLKIQAKNLGALIVLYSSNYTNTETNSGTIVLPQTNYYNGSVYGNGGTATFNGSSTGTMFVPVSNTQRRFDQDAIYFIKSNDKPKFGLSYVDISREKRIEIGKNGVIVNMIYENTPVYYSKLLEEDIIIKIDNMDIESAEQFDKILTEYDISKNISIFTIIRNNEEKNIEIKFKGEL